MHPPIPVSSQVAMSIVSSILTLASVTGNSFFFAIVARFRALHTVPNILAANLALVDLLNAAINMPIYLIFAVFEADWFKGKLLAIMTVFLHRVFITLYLASKVSMMFNLYMAIAFDLKYLAWKTKEKALKATVFLWFASFVLSLLTCLPLLKTEFGDAPVKYYRAQFYQEGRSFAGFIFVIFITCVAVLGLLTCHAIRRKDKKRADLRLPPLETRARLKADIKAAKTVVISVVTNMAGYTPAVMYAAFGFERNSLADSWFAFIAWISLFISNATNPLLYLCRARRVRSALRQFIKDPFGNSAFREQESRSQVKEEKAGDLLPRRTRFERAGGRHDAHYQNQVVTLSNKKSDEQDVQENTGSQHTRPRDNEHQIPLKEGRICQENQGRSKDSQPNGAKNQSNAATSKATTQEGPVKREEAKKPQKKSRAIPSMKAKALSKVTPLESNHFQNISPEMTTHSRKAQDGEENGKRGWQGQGWDKRFRRGTPVAWATAQNPRDYSKTVHE